MIRIGVVIVNYNGRGYVAECLRSIRASSFAPAAVVVIDNGSSDGSADSIASEFSELQLVRSAANLGFAAAANRGVRLCLDQSCDAVVLLNPDTVIEPTLLGALAEAAARHPRSLLTPAIAHLGRPGLSDSYAGPLQWWRGRMRSPFLDQPHERLPASDTRVETASFCCVFLPAAALRELGPLDEDYFLYFEDADYLARTAQAGFALWYVPAARLRHAEGSSTGGRRSALALYYYIRNRHLFVRKFRRGHAVYALFLAYSAADVLARAAWALVTGKPSLSRALLRGAADGWAGGKGHAPDAHRL